MANTIPFSQLDTEEQQRLRDKLAKLKALSECQTGNVNETATAAATMTRIMLEYQIEMAELDQPQNGEVIEKTALPASYRGFPAWQTTLLSALATVNHCKSYTSRETEYELFGKRFRHSLYLIGTEEDIDNTLRLFHFCLDEIERLCYCWSPRAAVKRKNDFRTGAANGIAVKVLTERDRVIEEEERRSAEKSEGSTALQLFQKKDEAVAEFAAGIGLRTVTRRTRAVSRDAYQAGYKAGSQMKLDDEYEDPELLLF